jgi:hypothetical protein
MWWNSARFWKVRPMPSEARALGVRPVISRPLIEQLAFGRLVAAGNTVHDGGLAGAVGADDREQLAVLDGEADIGQRTDAAEPQGHAAHFKTGSHQTNPSR